MVFLSLNDLMKNCTGCPGPDACFKAARVLIESCILPVFVDNGNDVVLVSDYMRLKYVLEQLAADDSQALSGELLVQKDSFIRLKLSSDTTVYFPRCASVKNSSFYSSIHGLISSVSDSTNEDTCTVIEGRSYFLPSKVFTRSHFIVHSCESHLERSSVLSTVEASQFANTAYYMGSKRSVLGFLVEAVSHITPDDGVVVDLMCGSGSATAGFSRYWPTISSDVQSFCTCLSKVQGGGFDRNKASSLIDRLIPHARAHLGDLCNSLSPMVDKEDDFFHSDIDLDLVRQYVEFHKDYVVYPRTGNNLAWSPYAEVQRRRKVHSLYPYCLFTAYYANIFLGVRQCIEVDSLRFAIDQLTDDNERLWALGALVATVSSLATTYAGHFAQPPFSNIENLTIPKVAKLIDKRSNPITQEFCIRLLALSRESELASYPVEVVPGPWKIALDECEKTLSEKPVTVYLDAPYTRDEYSRYYHVLETLVAYNYPSVSGKASVPDKRTGGRAHSEFFTRNKHNTELALANVISSVVARGWNCLWSYSDTGCANMANVIENVVKFSKCHVKSCVAPHRHNSQGGMRPKQVLEYAVSFISP